MHKFLKYVCCFSLHVSGNYVPIIGRKYSTYATPGICRSIHVDGWYAEQNAQHTRVTNTRCRISTVFSPDDGYIVARNM